MVNVEWLRTFCTLVEVGHFTRTAEQLHMTQSGVSQHIKKLETQLGTALLVRDGKQFSLSDAGRTLFSEGQEILQSLLNLERNVTEDPAYEGAVRVMSPGSVGLKLYPHLLELQAQHPALTIEYKFAPNHDIESGIAKSEADVGFMTCVSELSQLHCEPVAEEQLLLITPASLEQANWDALCQLGFIDHPDGDYHASLLLGSNYPEYEHSRFFKRKGFSNQISLVLEPVSRGMGFTVLPAYAVEFFARPETIRVHALATPVSETIYVCRRRQETLPCRVGSVVEEAKRWL